jgi:hypothetical protein
MSIPMVSEVNINIVYVETELYAEIIRQKTFVTYFGLLIYTGVFFLLFTAYESKTTILFGLKSNFNVYVNKVHQS